MSENQIGQRITALREIAGLNRSELARKVGVSPQAIQKWEVGGGVRVERLLDLTGALNCTVGDLIGDEEPGQIVVGESKKVRAPQDSDKYIVRFPEGMRDKIAEAAKANNRSMNAEIIAHLSSPISEVQSLKDDFAKVILQGLVMSGRIDWENPNPDLLRCWRLAAKAVTARDMAI